jgi:signal peptidase I
MTGAGARHSSVPDRRRRPPKDWRPKHVHRRRPLPLWQELPLLLVIALGLALLIKTFLVQAFYIPSGSMENTLHVRDRVLVNKVVYDWREPHRGEVIVFRGTDSWVSEGGVAPPKSFLQKVGRGLGEIVGAAQPDERDFVKRVIGLPGDSVQCCDAGGRVTVNGHGLDEPYVFDNTPATQRPFGPVLVPAGRLFVLGDHRRISGDSRQYLADTWQGTVPVDHVIGRAFVKVWPFANTGWLDVPSTFGALSSGMVWVTRPDRWLFAGRVRRSRRPRTLPT